MQAERFDIDDLENERELERFLESDRIWNVYALCDLEEPFRSHARFIGARAAGDLKAALLVYQFPESVNLIPLGSELGVQDIVRRAVDLPPRAHFGIRRSDVPAFTERYHIERSRDMLRMEIQDRHFIPATHPGEVTQLSVQELPQIWKVYEHFDEHFFTDLMLEQGVFFGVWSDSELVAIAGTQTVSDRFSLATIGGVFTHPAHRGHGLAQLTTGAVVATLLRRGVQDVFLNVAAGNDPAIAAYRRIGFQECLRFLEGWVITRR
jgi:ribosomal protein S18 acetylase RimI-like enzyme